MVSPDKTLSSEGQLKVDQSLQDSTDTSSSLYSGGNAFSHTPRSTSSSSHLTSVSLISSDDDFQKPSFMPKLRTQAQTSSSSGSIPAEGRSISSSINMYHPPVVEPDEKDEMEQNSPEFTSTPFISTANGRRMADLNLQLSGESAGSQPLLDLTSKPELSLSPTEAISLPRLQFPSSSSSEDERKRLKSPLDETQGYDIPNWCKEYQKKHMNDSEGSLLQNSLSEELVPKETTSTGSVSSTEISSNRIKMATSREESTELVMSGVDMFNPTDSEQQQEEAVPKEDMESQITQPFLGFELSQDFSQNLVADQDLLRPSIKKTVQTTQPEDSSDSTPFHFSLTKKVSDEPASQSKSIAFEKAPTKSEDFREFKVLDKAGPSNEDIGTHSDQKNTNKRDQQLYYNTESVKSIFESMVAKIGTKAFKNAVYATVGSVPSNGSPEEQSVSSALDANGDESKRSKSTVARKKVRQVVPTLEVFALWKDGLFYPAVVTEVLNDGKSVKVTYHDNKVRNVSCEEILLDIEFQSGQEVMVLKNGRSYQPATVTSCKRLNKELLYVLSVGLDHEVFSWSDICLSKDQYDGLVTKLDVSMEPPEIGRTCVQSSKSLKKRKRSTEPPLSSSSSTIEDEVVRKKLKTSIGSIPSISTGRGLFDGICFLLTSDLSFDVSYENNSTQSEDSSGEVSEFDIVQLSLLIKQHGGVVIEKLNRRELQRNPTKKVVCITNKPCHTFKFLYCIVVGIPIVWETWITCSLENNRLASYGSHIVNAGKDITNHDVFQIYTETSEKKREDYTPLCSLRVYVHMENEQKKYSREIDLLLEAVGCERVAKTFYVNKNTKKLLFPVETIDYVLTLSQHVPKVLRREAKSADKIIVTYKWLVQCLINNTLLDADCSPAFKYQHQYNSSNDSNK